MMWPNFIPRDLLKVDGQKHEQIRNHIPTCWFNSYLAMVESVKKTPNKKQTNLDCRSPVGSPSKKKHVTNAELHLYLYVGWKSATTECVWCLMPHVKNHLNCTYFLSIYPPENARMSPQKTDRLKRKWIIFQSIDFRGICQFSREVPLAGKYGLCISAFLAPNGFRYLKWRNPHPFSCNKCMAWSEYMAMYGMDFTDPNHGPVNLSPHGTPVPPWQIRPW